MNSIEIIDYEDPLFKQYIAQYQSRLQKLLKDSFGTVALMPAKSKEEKLRELFGSWIESGTEDKDLEDLYKSRLIKSTEPD